MTITKPVLILQLRPEDVTANSEYACFLKYCQLRAENTRRIRIEKNGIPDIGSYIFRNFVTSRLQTRTLAEYAINEMGMKRFAIMYPKV